MSLGKTFVAAIQETLQKLSSENSEPQQFARTIEGYNFEVGVRDFDKYTMLLEGLNISTRKVDSDAQLTVEKLNEKAKHLSEKVTYFLENLQLIETDSIKLEAQMRSETPSTDNGELSYFEVMLHGNTGISLHRYKYDQATKTREKIPFLITTEVLQRCADDFIEALRAN